MILELFDLFFLSFFLLGKNKVRRLEAECDERINLREQEWESREERWRQKIRQLEEEFRHLRLFVALCFKVSFFKLLLRTGRKTEKGGTRMSGGGLRLGLFRFPLIKMNGNPWFATVGQEGPTQNWSFLRRAKRENFKPSGPWRKCVGVWSSEPENLNLS